MKLFWSPLDVYWTPVINIGLSFLLAFPSFKTGINDNFERHAEVSEETIQLDEAETLRIVVDGVICYEFNDRFDVVENNIVGKRQQNIPFFFFQ